MKKEIILIITAAALFGFFGQSAAAPKGTLTVAQNSECSGLDPLLGGTSHGLAIHRCIYDGLMHFGNDGKMQPRLATSWELIDEKTWRFHLRKGVKFHNGYPFTAADVKFTIEWLLAPENKWNFRSYFNDFDRVDIIDDYTIDVKSKHSDPGTPARWTAWVRFASKKFFDEVGKEKFQSTAIGTGPFKFVKWKRKDRLILKANNDWYLPPPKIENLIFRLVPEMGARVAELQSGGAQIISSVPPFMLSQLRKAKNIKPVTVPSLRAFYMIIDSTKTPALKDVRVRQALNYAIDKQSIIKGILNGMGTPLGTHVPEPVIGANKSIKPYPYNLEKAKALLKEAGYADGFELILNSPNGRYLMDKEVTLAIADQLTKLGIKTEVKTMETGTYFKELVNHRLSGLYFIGMGTGEWDISDSLNQLPSDHVLCHHPSPEMDKMVAEAKKTMDAGKRYALADKIQQIVHDEAIFLFLYNGTLTYGVSERVKGFEPRSDEMMELWKVSLAD